MCLSRYMKDALSVLLYLLFDTIFINRDVFLWQGYQYQLMPMKFIAGDYLVLFIL
jgi:hypothetical protein